MAQGSLFDCLYTKKDSDFCYQRRGLKVLVDLAEGLRYLHTRKPPVIHNDIKSANALINGDGTAKWADVGLAKHMHSMGGTVVSQAGGTIACTQEYAAPEVLQAIICADKSATVTEKSDVFSFGVLIREVYLVDMPSKANRQDGFPIEETAPIYPMLRGGDGIAHGGALASDVGRRCTTIDLKTELEQLGPRA